MEFGMLFTVGAMVVSAAATWIIKKFSADKVIGDLSEEINEHVGNVVVVQETITNAFTPDSEGKVELTADEVKEIYKSMDDLLSGFGIDLPDWPS